MNHLMQFIAMGGYGFYVWTAYGVVAASLGFQWWQAWRERS